MAWLRERLPPGALAAVGHRVVHGGERFAPPARIDPGVLAALEQLIPLAPLHQPHNLAAIRAINRAKLVGIDRIMGRSGWRHK